MRPRDGNNPATLDATIAAQESAVQPTLRELRALIRDEGLDANERIAWLPTQQQF